MHCDVTFGLKKYSEVGATDDLTEQCFKAGTLAVMDAIEEVAIHE